MVTRFEAQSAHTSNKLKSHQQEIDAKQQAQKDDFEDDSKKLGLERLNARLVDNINNAIEPQSWSWFDDYANPK